MQIWRTLRAIPSWIFALVFGAAVFFAPMLGMDATNTVSCSSPASSPWWSVV